MKSVTGWDRQHRVMTPRPQDQVIAILKEFVEQIAALKNESKREESAAFVPASACQ